MHFAADSLPALGPPATPRAAATLLFGAWGGSGGGGEGSPRRGPRLGAGAAAARGMLSGQWRYGEYLSRLLHHSAGLPPDASQPLLLRKVVCSKLGCFAEAAASAAGGSGDGGGGGGGSPRKSPRRDGGPGSEAWPGGPGGGRRTLLAVFHRGRRVWSQGESLASWGEGDDTVAFSTDLVLRWAGLAGGQGGRLAGRGGWPAELRCHGMGSRATAQAAAQAAALCPAGSTTRACLARPPPSPPCARAGVT